MPLRIRMAPDGRSKEQHAKQLMKKVGRALDNQPLVDNVMDAMVPGHCYECETRMWQNLSGIPHFCEPCRIEREEDKKQQNLMARMMGAIKNDGMAHH